jgi:putative transposase
MFLSILFNAEIIPKHASPASKLCKPVKIMLQKPPQKILRRYSRLGIDDPSRALTVHLLCTGPMSNSISLMMQCLGRQYVGYFNVCYGRSGTLWEGCYKSCFVQGEDYLLHLYGYIGLNPVRANRTNMMEDPADYHGSSYHINGLGKESKLCTPHPIYLALPFNAIQRKAAYRSLFSSHIVGQ